MRLLLAAVLDIVAACILTFAAFRLAVIAASCRDLGECTVLGPSVVVLVLAVLVLYFGGSFALFGTTPGRYLVGGDTPDIYR